MQISLRPCLNMLELGIEFKSPTGNYRVSEAQKEMKKPYVNNGYAYILCTDYDKICKAVHEYMKGIRVPCKYCNKDNSHSSISSCVINSRLSISLF